MDSQLIIPVFDLLFPFLPEKILTKLRWGVRYRRNSIQVDNVLFFAYGLINIC
jgi:hypothetical protein